MYSLYQEKGTIRNMLIKGNAVILLTRHHQRLIGPHGQSFTVKHYVKEHFCRKVH